MRCCGSGPVRDFLENHLQGLDVVSARGGDAEFAPEVALSHLSHRHLRLHGQPRGAPLCGGPIDTSWFL